MKRSDQMWQLVEKRAQDGAQRFVAEDGDVQWFSGIQRVDAPIGAVGTMTYEFTPSHGWDRFRVEFVVPEDHP